MRAKFLRTQGRASCGFAATSESLATAITFSLTHWSNLTVFILKRILILREVLNNNTQQEEVKMLYIKTEDFPAILLQYLEKAGKTQAAFARELGVPKQTVSNWVKGRNMPSYKRLEKILEMMEE